MKKNESKLPNSVRIYLHSSKVDSICPNDFEEAARIADKFPKLLDKIQGHFQGWHSGELKNQIPTECLRALLINLIADNIINWENVPDIPITQKTLPKMVPDNEGKYWQRWNNEDVPF